MITYKEYQKFLRSKKWKKFSKKLLSKTKGCSICGKSTRLVIHHLSYPSYSDFLNPRNLKVLCKTCHGLLHAIRENSIRFPCQCKDYKVGEKNFLKVKKKILKIYISKGWKTHLERKNRLKEIKKKSAP